MPRASATRELVFQDCRVPAANLLGKEGTGFMTAMKTFDASRPGIGAQAVGIAQAAFEDIDAFFAGLDSRRPAGTRSTYRYRTLALRFIRSVGRTSQYSSMPASA
mgnify:CR=1 FL=1